MALIRKRDRFALPRFQVVVCSQRGFERGAGTLGNFQPVVKDSMPVGCEKDPHTAPRALKPAEKEPSPRTRELPSEPTVRVERRIERIRGQQLELHTRAKGTTREHQAQRGHDQYSEQGTAEQREEIGPNRGRAEHTGSRAVPGHNVNRQPKRHQPRKCHRRRSLARSRAPHGATPAEIKMSANPRLAGSQYRSEHSPFRSGAVGEAKIKRGTEDQIEPENEVTIHPPPFARRVVEGTTLPTC